MNRPTLTSLSLVIIAFGVVILVLIALLGQLSPLAGEPSVVFAKGVAHCEGGSYEGITTGNKSGQCKQLESDPDGNTIKYQCSDGEGNSATVDCQANRGLGLCESQGSGDCGKFKPAE